MLVKIVLYSIAAILIVAFQTTFGALISIYEIKPDIILLFIIYLALAEKRMTVTLLGFGLGLVEGLMGTGLFGLAALSKTIAGFIASSFRGQKSYRQFYEPLAVVGLTCFCHDLLMYSLLSFGSPMSLWQAIFRYALPTTIYSIVFGAILFALIPKTVWFSIPKARWNSS